MVSEGGESTIHHLPDHRPPAHHCPSPHLPPLPRDSTSYYQTVFIVSDTAVFTPGMQTNIWVNGPDQQLGQDMPFQITIRKSLEGFVHYISFINGEKNRIYGAYSSTHTRKTVNILSDLLAVIQMLKHFHRIFIISDAAEVECDGWASVSKEGSRDIL